MPTLHLIHGFVGAGKTTFSKKLETEKQRVRFTCDEWMIALFGSNPPKSYFDKYLPKIKSLIWSEAKRFLGLGQDVILDFGFWQKAEREHYKKLAFEMGVKVQLYNLKCPEDIMKARVLKRTNEMPPGTFFIDENALHEFKGHYEPIDPETEESIEIHNY